MGAEKLYRNYGKIEIDTVPIGDGNRPLLDPLLSSIEIDTVPIGDGNVDPEAYHIRKKVLR